MLGRVSRTAAAVLMAGLIVGAAIVFALGVPIHSAAVCNNEVSYGVICPGNPIGAFTVSSPGVARNTFYLGRGGILTVVLINPTDNTVVATLSLSYTRAHGARALAGRRHLVRKRVTLPPHQNRRVKLRTLRLRTGTLVIRLRDSLGNTRTITKRVGPQRH